MFKGRTWEEEGFVIVEIIYYIVKVIKSSKKDNIIFYNSIITLKVFIRNYIKII